MSRWPYGNGLELAGQKYEVIPGSDEEGRTVCVLRLLGKGRPRFGHVAADYPQTPEGRPSQVLSTLNNRQHAVAALLLTLHII